MAQVNIKIDGRPIAVEEGTFILQAAHSLGIEIPTLCYFKYVKPYAACRICVVEVWDKRGKNRVVTACNYPAEEGLEVLTHTPRVLAARRLNLEMLMSRCAPMPVLTDLAAKLGNREAALGHGHRHLHPLRPLRARLRRDRRGAGDRLRLPRDRPRGHDALRARLRGLHPLRRLRRPLPDRPHPDGGIARAGGDPPRDLAGTERGDLRPVPPGRSERAADRPGVLRPLPHRAAAWSAPRSVPKECIDYEEAERIEEVEVGTVILATGFQDFEPGRSSSTATGSSRT